MHSSFRGVFPALVTPMTADEEVDYSCLERTVEHLVASGVHGLIPLGSTGEFYALTPDERQAVLRTVIDTTGGRIPIVAGVNAASTREVVGYCRQAEELGAAGLLVAPPFYSLPRPNELFEHVQAVDRAVGIPIMLYNYPGRTGVDITPDLIERLAELKNVRYIKESSGDMSRMSRLVRNCGNITVFCGCDTLALESLILGVPGWVAGAANVLPAEHVRLFDLAAKQEFDAARRLYFRMMPILSLMEEGGKYTQYVKAGCGLVGRPVGPPRRPLLAPTEDELHHLREALAGFARTA